MAKPEIKYVKLGLPKPLYNKLKREAEKDAKTLSGHARDILSFYVSVLGEKNGEKRSFPSPDVRKKIAEIPWS